MSPSYYGNLKTFRHVTRTLNFPFAVHSFHHTALHSRMKFTKFLYAACHMCMDRIFDTAAVIARIKKFFSFIFSSSPSTLFPVVSLSSFLLQFAFLVQVTVFFYNITTHSQIWFWYHINLKPIACIHTWAKEEIFRIPSQEVKKLLLSAF